MKTSRHRLLIRAGRSRTGFARALVAMLVLWVITATASGEATVYVNGHYEVRDHDEPVKYVFNGPTRIARITTSLASNTRVQRLRLSGGWNLCSVAVGGAPLPRRLPGQSTDLVVSAFQWRPATRIWVTIRIDEPLVAGAVLWLRSITNAVLAVQGICPEPVSQTIEKGGSFYPSAGMTALSLRAQHVGNASGSLAGFNAAEQTWLLQQSSIAASDPGSPDFIAPGEAVFIHSDTVLSLEAPVPAKCVHFYHADHLGSATVMTDAEGTLHEETAYYPFGLPRQEHRLRELEEAYAFTQKERDRESGLHYFEARYLAGGLARFATIDPKYAHPDGLSPDDVAKLLTLPQRLNLYAYVSSNPLKHWDPSGLDEEKSPGLVDTADTFVDRMGFLTDINKLDGPGLAFDVIGVTIKTGKFVNDPSLFRGVAVGYDATKAVLTAKCPPVGLALQGLDLIGIGPGSFIDWAADADDANIALLKAVTENANAWEANAKAQQKLSQHLQKSLVQAEADIKQREERIIEKDDLLKRMDERLSSSNKTLKRGRQQR